MDRIEALAEAWASIDGKLEAFKRERDADPPIDHDDPSYTGHFEGYMVEAEEMIVRLEARGFTVAPLPE